MAHFQYEKPDFSFISSAANKAAQGIVDYGKAKNLKIDQEDAQKVYHGVISEAAKRYQEITGDTDPNRAEAFAMRHYLPMSRNEQDPEKFITRLQTVSEPAFNKALEDLKRKQFFIDTEKNKPQQYVRPEGNVEVSQPRAAAQPGTPEFAKKPSSFDGLAGMQARAMSEPLPSDIMTGPVETAQMKAARANKLGVGEDKTVVKDIQGTRNVQDANAYIPGMTKATYAQAVGQNEGDVEAGIARGMYGALSSEKDLMDDARLKQAEEQRSKLRMTLARMQDARDRSKNLDKNTLKLLDTQIHAVTAQINASKATSDLAMGIPTGKDYMGQTTFSTGPEWEKEYTDAETTYQSATALLDKVDALNRKINPSPADKPVTLPATMTASEQAAFQWLKNPASAKDPNYNAVREKLSRKYSDLVR